MKRPIIALVFLSFGLALPAVGQTPTVPANSKTAQNTITLSEEQKQTVINAAVSDKTRQKTPKDFSPTLGATVPKDVYVHGFKPDVTEKTPLLKEYWYAFLDREIVLVVGPKNIVVAVVALPEKLVASEQPYQGASESSTDAKGSTGSTTSVPSHTAPESIK